MSLPLRGRPLTMLKLLPFGETGFGLPERVRTVIGRQQAQREYLKLAVGLIADIEDSVLRNRPDIRIC